MSPNNPGNFVNDLVEMAKAFEALPKVEAERDDLIRESGEKSDLIQSLQLRIIDYKNQIDSLHSRIRSLEVERDEAQFHTLEADDRTSRALDFIKATFGNAGSLIQALEPARAEEPKVAELPVAGDPNQDTSMWGGAPAEHPQGESASPLSASDANSLGSNSAMPQAVSTTENAPQSTDPAPEVAAQPDPTKAAEAPDASGPTHADTKADASDGHSTDQSFSMPAQSKPFEGRRYSEVVKLGKYPSRDEWEAGGGTVDNWFA